MPESVANTLAYEGFQGGATRFTKDSVSQGISTIAEFKSLSENTPPFSTQGGRSALRTILRVGYPE
ncbi:MAG: hypothetical protein V3S12_02360 [Acidiferrobacterales bacterium]